MIKELWKEYNSSLSEKQKCPACGEKCIGYYKKLELYNPIYNGKCPNCNAKLSLYGSICIIDKIIWYAIIAYAIVLFVAEFISPSKVESIHVYIFVLLVILRNFYKQRICVPYAKIRIYDSTPMDDLIILIEKLNLFLKSTLNYDIKVYALRKLDLIHSNY